jgi:hypothetical protein
MPSTHSINLPRSGSSRRVTRSRRFLLRPHSDRLQRSLRRWVAALESGDDAELLEATVGLPTLNKRVLKKLAAVDRDEPDPTARAERKRVIVLLSEINANRGSDAANVSKRSSAVATEQSASSAESSCRPPAHGAAPSS